MTDAFPARFYDGQRAAATSGTVRLVSGLLEFRPERGAAQRIELAAIRSISTVATEVHLELDAGPELPSAKLVVDEPSFEPLLDETRRALGGRGAALERVSRRMPVWGWVAIAVVAVPLAYVVFVGGAEAAHVLVSVEAERALGDFVYEQLSEEWPPIHDPELQGMLDDMARRLAGADSPYELRVSVVESEEANAFALPGGRIVLFSGMLTLSETPDAVAGVLAHEIAHVEQRHGIKGLLRTVGIAFFATTFIGGGLDQLETAETLSELASALVVLGYSRDAEREADALAVDKLHGAGHDVGGLITFFERLSERYDLGETEEHLEWISSHPVTRERIEMLRSQQRDGVSSKREWVDDSAAWERALERIGEGASAGAGDASSSGG